MQTLSVAAWSTPWADRKGLRITGAGLTGWARMEMRHPPTTGELDLAMATGRPAELGDEELVTLAQQGRRDAFEVLVERHGQKAYRIAFDFTRDREEAKDLSQDAFLQAFTHLQGFNKRSSFYTWFYRILVNLCLDHCRRRGRIAWESLEEKHEKGNGLVETTRPSSTVDQQVMARELSRRLGDALQTLPAKQRTAFLLKNNEGLTISEIAKVMKAAEGTVKTHLHRAVMALKQSLGEFA
jgi:RNA polymerase sigma-70 factor (ECF subfamily)